MKLLGEVVEIFSTKAKRSILPRPTVKELKMVTGYGIIGDKFAGKNEDQSVMIVGKNTYTIAKKNNIELQKGSFGENILLNFNPHELELGATLVIEDAQISLTKECTVCDHLAVFDTKLPKIVKNKRGIYCKIDKNGTVKKGAKVYLKD